MWVLQVTKIDCDGHDDCDYTDVDENDGGNDGDDDEDDDGGGGDGCLCDMEDNYEEATDKNDSIDNQCW